MSPLHTVSRLPQPHTHPPSRLGSPQSHTCRRELARPGRSWPTCPHHQKPEATGGLRSGHPRNSLSEGRGAGGAPSPSPTPTPSTRSSRSRWRRRGAAGRVGEVAPAPLCGAAGVRPPPPPRQAGERGRGGPRAPAGEGGPERPRACHSQPAVTAWGRGRGARGPRSSGSRGRSERDGKRGKKWRERGLARRGEG